MHVGGIALGGGLVVSVATVAAIGLIILLASFQVLDYPVLDPGFLLKILPGVVLLLAVGIVDDLWHVRGIHKLFGQVAAAWLLISQGIRFDAVTVFGWEIALYGWAVPFTLFFFLGAINAFNLLDGADGLATSIGLVVCLTLGIIAASRGSIDSALLCFAFSGALAGFLKFNSPPASIYLGDTGSMLIGIIVAAVAIQCSVKQQVAMALVVPATIFAIPVLDATAALVRRIMTGQSIFTGDRGHLHHALLLRGWSVVQTVVFITGLTAITCGGALASYILDSDVITVVVTLLVVAALAGARIFGNAELALIRSQARTLARTVILGRIPGRTHESQETVHIQGHCGWEKIWSALLEMAGDYKLSGIRLNVNIPRLHESYYGNWNQPSSSAQDDVWKITLPLQYEGQTIGKLSILGDSARSNGMKAMQEVLDFLEPLENNFSKMLGDRLSTDTATVESAEEEWASLTL